ncbi:hypothetical protein SKAU_G00387430 [Synaphobranchus kaupii]|uniref:CCHC-type domain-containing protein n=1 Tax=Synaphobranchus kaupii TaxID=118154 RepID=A0A9Q1IDA2_SYNKA|nr:hypothetical protein SKAU_G00387430 [Synaphobranchus kaupii]
MLMTVSSDRDVERVMSFGGEGIVAEQRATRPRTAPTPKTCHKCGETGHLAKVCKKSGPAPGRASSGQGEHPKEGEGQPEERPEDTQVPVVAKALDVPVGALEGGPCPEETPGSSLAPGPSEDPDPAAGGLAAPGQEVAVFPFMSGGGFLRAFKYVLKAVETPKVQKGIGGNDQSGFTECILKRRMRGVKPAQPGRPIAWRGPKREKTNSPPALDLEGKRKDPPGVKMEGTEGPPQNFSVGGTQILHAVLVQELWCRGTCCTSLSTPKEMGVGWRDIFSGIALGQGGPMLMWRQIRRKAPPRTAGHRRRVGRRSRTLKWRGKLATAAPVEAVTQRAEVMAIVRQEEAFGSWADQDLEAAERVKSPAGRRQHEEEGADLGSNSFEGEAGSTTKVVKRRRKKVQRKAEVSLELQSTSGSNLGLPPSGVVVRANHLTPLQEEGMEVAPPGGDFPEFHSCNCGCSS